MIAMPKTTFPISGAEIQRKIFFCLEKSPSQVSNFFWRVSTSHIARNTHVCFIFFAAPAKCAIVSTGRALKSRRISMRHLSSFLGWSVWCKSTSVKNLYLYLNIDSPNTIWPRRCRTIPFYEQVCVCVVSRQPALGLFLAVKPLWWRRVDVKNIAG